jgi:hypothetical protein
MRVPLAEVKDVLRKDPVLEPVLGFSPKKQARLF